MTKKVVGLMSGTSGDGVTAAIVDITENKDDPGAWPSMKLISHLTIPFEDSMKRRIFALFHPDTARLDELCRMNVLLARELAKAFFECIKDAGLSPDDIDLIGSHGQTVCHLPPDEEAGVPGGTPSTLQIGDVSVLAELTGVHTVGNFRLRDMIVGGEGAPLVPLCDWVLFSHPTRGRVIQNIGGIANLTLLKPGAPLDEVIAYDTGPGNMLIDEAVRHLTGGRYEYDDRGERAARGRVDAALLDRWLEHPYFKAAPPKSTGRELFGRNTAMEMIEQAKAVGTTGDDLIATLTALTAKSIVLHYEREIRSGHVIDDCVIGGGGAYNETLVRWIDEELRAVASRLGGSSARPTVTNHESFDIPSEAKESMAFAYLGFATWTHRPGNVPGATGAYKPVVLGTISYGSRV